MAASKISSAGTLIVSQFELFDGIVVESLISL
jgi:hypothetical protein